MASVFKQFIRDRFFKIGLSVAVLFYILFQIGGIFLKNKTSTEHVPASLLDFGFIPSTSSSGLIESSFDVWNFQNNAYVATKKQLKDFTGKPFIVHLWATWCGPCREEMPALSAFIQKNIIPVLVVATEKLDEKAMAKFFEGEKLTPLPVVIDGERTLSNFFGVRGIPVTVLFNAKGEEVGRIQGKAPWGNEAFQKALYQHLKIEK